MKELKRYLFTHSVKDASGSQTFRVDAYSEEEAKALHDSGESDVYAQEVEVMDLDECSLIETTTLDDFGDFPPNEETDALESQQKRIAELEALLNHSVKIGERITEKAAKLDKHHDEAVASLLIVDALSEIVPVKDVIPALKNGRTMIDYFANVIKERDEFKQRIEQMEAAEPVAEIANDGFGRYAAWYDKLGEYPIGTNLYAKPQAAPVCLSDAEIQSAWRITLGQFDRNPIPPRAIEFARAIEAEARGQDAAQQPAEQGAISITERDMLDFAEKAGLWPNTIHHWLPALRRYTDMVLANSAKPAQDKDAKDAEICAYELPNNVKVERVIQRDGSYKWAVRQHGSCLNKSGEFEYEPISSSRDDDFLDRCRFSSAEEAISAAIAQEKQ